MVKGMRLGKSSTVRPIFWSGSEWCGEGRRLCNRAKGRKRQTLIGRQGVPKADALDVLEKRRQGDWPHHGLALFSDSGGAALLLWKSTGER